MRKDNPFNIVTHIDGKPIKDGEPVERGEASFKAELKNGVITIKHGTDGDAILAQWTGRGNDWDKIWSRIRRLEEESDE